MTAKIRYICQRCTACCLRPGFVRITETEIPRLAAHLGVHQEDFIQRYTRLTPQRSGLALIDRPDGACFFLHNGGCRLQAVKPAQCTGFPNEWNTPGWREYCQALPQVEKPAIP